MPERSKNGKEVKQGKGQRTPEELIQAVADLFNEVEPETPEEIEAVLREAGYDPDAIREQMKTIAERALSKQPQKWSEKIQTLPEKDPTRLK